MSNIFIVYDQNGNITQATSNYPQVTPPQQMLVCDDTTTNASNALAQPTNYMVQNGSIIPAVTINVARTHAVSGSWDVYTLTVTTSDNQAHTVNLSFLNQNVSVTTASVSGTYQATLQISLHNCLTSYQFVVTASATGLITLQTFIGGSGVSSVPSVQSYKDASGSWHIAPTQKLTLIGYYAAQVPQELAVPDLTTSDSLLMQAVFGIILPALTSGTTPIVSLDANQKNALTDIQNNVLPNIVTTLENVAPVPATGQAQTFDIHYASYKVDLATSKQAFNNYVADIQAIPNLVG